MQPTMKRIALKYGLVSGGIVAAMMAVMIPLHSAGSLDFEGSELVGYSTMVLAFLLVFFGIRAYREETAGGTIGFGKAFQVGILVTLVSCMVYVVCWEILYWGFYPEFLDQYDAHMLAKMRAAGESEAAIAAMQRDMKSFAELYANPLINAGITFLEIFPVGLIVTLVSAAILRRPSRAVVAGAVEAT